jgi:hypothetical protein
MRQLNSHLAMKELPRAKLKRQNVVRAVQRVQRVKQVQQVQQVQPVRQEATRLVRWTTTKAHL